MGSVWHRNTSSPVASLGKESCGCVGCARRYARKTGVIDFRNRASRVWRWCVNATRAPTFTATPQRARARVSVCGALRSVQAAHQQASGVRKTAPASMRSAGKRGVARVCG